MQVPAQGHDVSTTSTAEWFNPMLFQAADETIAIPDRPVESPYASDWSVSRSKRIVDFSTAFFFLSALVVPMLAIGICVRLTSQGPALFVQKRVGRRGHLFGIYKFRSMTVGSCSGPGLTRAGDRRITTVGRWIRKYKLDELPQFYNVLRGEMSLVGPRPKLPVYEPIANMPYRPGITGAATLAFRNEEDILGGIHPSQIEHFYAREIKPLKAQIDLQYMSQATLGSDLRMIAATFMACFTPVELAVSLRGDEREPVKDSMTA
jgi:lipopolysaccharide/colanic/teichoic acid biosynthesis glycosyltransferase